MSTRMCRYNSNGAQNGASFPKDPNGGGPLFIFQVKIIQEASLRQLHRFPEISSIMIRDGKIQIACRDTGTPSLRYLYLELEVERFFENSDSPIRFWNSALRTSSVRSS